MRNPIENTIRGLLQQSGGNIQNVAQNILKNNPDFANAIQGQNLQELASKAMANSGISPQMFMNNMFNNKF